MSKIPFFEQKNMSGWKRWLPGLIVVLLLILLARNFILQDLVGFIGVVVTLVVVVLQQALTSRHDALQHRLDFAKAALENAPWEALKTLGPLLDPASALGQRVRRDESLQEQLRETVEALQRHSTSGRIVEYASQQARERRAAAVSVLADLQLLFAANDPSVPAGGANLPLKDAIQAVERLLTDTDAVLAADPYSGLNGLRELFAKWDVLTAGLFAAGLARLVALPGGRTIVLSAFRTSKDLRRLLDDRDVRCLHDDLRELAVEPDYIHRYHRLPERPEIVPSKENLQLWSARLKKGLRVPVDHEAPLAGPPVELTSLGQNAFGPPLMLRCRNHNEVFLALSCTLPSLKIERFPLVFVFDSADLARIEKNDKIMDVALIGRMYQHWLALLAAHPEIYQDMTAENKLALARLFVYESTFAQWLLDFQTRRKDTQDHAAAERSAIVSQVVIDGIRQNCEGGPPGPGFDLRRWLALRPSTFQRTMLVFALRVQTLGANGLHSFHQVVDREAKLLQELGVDVLVLAPENADPGLALMQTITWEKEELKNSLQVWTKNLLPDLPTPTFEEIFVLSDQSTGEQPAFTAEDVARCADGSLDKLYELLDGMLQRHLKQYPPDTDDGRLTLEDAEAAGIVLEKQEAQ